MDRRQFVSAAAGSAMASLSTRGDSVQAQTAMTVNGPVGPDELGVTLPHEHILVDFIGADKVGRDRYDADEVFRIALPYLEQARDKGVRTLVECTPAYIGRNAELCRRLSKASRLHIITNTGYYGAANDKFVPAHAYEETADQLARRWTAEWRNGIEGTGIKPGFIKVGVDSGPLSEIDAKLVRAAARTHLATGLTIASHTGNNGAGTQTLKILKEQGVDGSAFIWVHAQNERNLDDHVSAAEAGAWIEFDNIGPKSIERNLELLVNMKKHNLLGRVLLSHDRGWYHVGEPGGGNYQPYTPLFDEFIPALKKAGVTSDEITQLTITNPRQAFSV